MFSIQERSAIRDALIAWARADVDVIGAALVGSAARSQEDAWSDIDLALQLGEGADEPTVVERWTHRMAQEFGVADRLDVMAGAVRYRVFLLASSLQVDLSFWPHDQFRATEESFLLVFGSANDPTMAVEPDIEKVIGMGWLYALHARSAIARGRLWQAVMMLDDLRNQVITLASLRYGLNPWHGREVDRLPTPIRDELQISRASEVAADALKRSLALLIEQFLTEIEFHDAAKAVSLRGPFEAHVDP